MGQQAARAILHFQFAQRVAAIVIGHDIVEARADIVHSHDFEQKLGELPDLGLECVRGLEHGGVFVEQLGKVMRDHRRARA